MPDPRDKVKKTGDTHLPDTESEFSVDQANAQAADRMNEAGVPNDRDAQASDRSGKTRDSGKDSGKGAKRSER